MGRASDPAQYLKMCQEASITRLSNPKLAEVKRHCSREIKETFCSSSFTSQTKLQGHYHHPQGYYFSFQKQFCSPPMVKIHLIIEKSRKIKQNKTACGTISLLFLHDMAVKLFSLLLLSLLFPWSNHNILYHACIKFPLLPYFPHKFLLLTYFHYYQSCCTILISTESFLYIGVYLLHGP